MVFIVLCSYCTYTFSRLHWETRVPEYQACFPPYCTIHPPIPECPSIPEYFISQIGLHSFIQYFLHPMQVKTRTFFFDLQLQGLKSFEPLSALFTTSALLDLTSFCEVFSWCSLKLQPRQYRFTATASFRLKHPLPRQGAEALLPILNI